MLYVRAPLRLPILRTHPIMVFFPLGLSILLTLQYCMGWIGHTIFNTRWNTAGFISPLHECQSKSAALEASGLIYNLYARYLQRNPQRAERQARHIHEHARLSTEDIVELAKIFLEDMKLYRQIFTTKFLVVFEGWPYFFKKRESQTRAAKPFENFERGKFSEAWRVCDCLSKLIIFEMMKDSAIYGEPLVAVCEADAQLAILCAMNIVDYLICTSGDADYLVYIGIPKIIYSPSLRLPTASRPLVLMGVVVLRKHLRRQIDIVLDKARTTKQGQSLPARCLSVDFSLWSDFKFLVLP